MTPGIEDNKLIITNSDSQNLAYAKTPEVANLPIYVHTLHLILLFSYSFLNVYSINTLCSMLSILVFKIS